MDATLESDLTRAANILSLLAPALEDHAQSAVRSVAAALHAIVDEQRAKQRLNCRAADLAETFRELYEHAGQPVL